MNKEKNIIRKSNRVYEEVKFGETGTDKRYKNPLTEVFQYEYALFKAVSDLFESVDCRSMCVDSLKLYFSELPKKETQELLLTEMAMLVARDVVGAVKFPMINICRAEVAIVTGADGTHTFIFGDGTYGFGVHLDMRGKGRPKAIEVLTELSVYYHDPFFEG